MTTLAEQQKADQAKLAALLAREVAPMVTPQPSAGAVKDLIAGLVAVVAQYNRASAGIAADYFEAQRAAAGITDRLTVPLAELPDEDQMVHAFGWATRDLGPRGRSRPEPATMPWAPDTPAADAVDLDAVLGRVNGAATRLALDGGRSTLVGAARTDPRCRGYVRTASAGACAFCAMLATRVFDTDRKVRGVYKTAESAQRRGRGQRDDAYHDDCRCGVRPIFRGEDYKPAAVVREWLDIYSGATPDSGQSKLDAFRQALATDRGEPAR